MSTTRTKKAPTAEQCRKVLTKRIGDQFKLAMYTAIDDLRSDWERSDIIARADQYQTTENLKAGQDDKMVVRELATIVPTVYEMLWVLCNELVLECNRADFPAGFVPSSETIASHLDECISDAVTPAMIQFSTGCEFGTEMNTFADPAQTVQNSIRGLLTSLTTREILVAMLPKIFVEFLKSLAQAVATYVWYNVQCKPSFVASRVDEALISALLVIRGFPAGIVDRMYGGILPKVKKSTTKLIKTSATDTAQVPVVDDIAAMIESAITGSNETTAAADSMQTGVDEVIAL